MTARRVLLTGASGAIGTELALALAQTGCNVLPMLHTATELVRNNGDHVALYDVRLRPVHGDVTQDQLGLSSRDYAQLVASTDLIVHAAAVTDFGLPAAIYQAVNEEGTRRILELARAREPSIPVLHVSTAYVCGERSGRIPEQAAQAGHAFANDYEASKFRAETLVREAARAGVPTVIARPSIVVGSGRDGVTREFKNIYTVLKVMGEGRLSAIPANADALLDLVPVDYVVAVLRELVLRFEEAVSRTFHLVSGRPLTLRDCSEVLAEYPSLLMPRFIPPPAFSEQRLTPIERAYYTRLVRLYAPYLRRRASFVDDETRRFAAVRHSSQGKPMLRKLLDYCMRVAYLGVPRPTVESVLRSLPEAAVSHAPSP